MFSGRLSAGSGFVPFDLCVRDIYGMAYLSVFSYYSLCSINRYNLFYDVRLLGICLVFLSFITMLHLGQDSMEEEIFYVSGTIDRYKDRQAGRSGQNFTD